MMIGKPSPPRGGASNPTPCEERVAKAQRLKEEEL